VNLDPLGPRHRVAHPDRDSQAQRVVQTRAAVRGRRDSVEGG
jgi:hypothetical protein